MAIANKQKKKTDTSTKKTTNLADSVSTSINQTQSTIKKTSASQTNKSNASKYTSSNKTSDNKAKISSQRVYTSNAKDSIDKSTQTNNKNNVKVTKVENKTQSTPTKTSQKKSTNLADNVSNSINKTQSITNTKTQNTSEPKYKTTQSNSNNKTLYDVENNNDGWSFKKANQRIEDLKKTNLDFENDDAYERHLTENNISLSSGNALNYFQNKAKLNGTTARDEAIASRTKWKNTLDTEELETKYRSGELSDDDVSNINNSFGTLIDSNGNRVDTEQYQKDIETYQKNSESINKEIEKLNSQFESNLINQDNYQLMYKNLETKWNQNEELGNSLQSVSSVQGFDYYNWAKEHGEDVSDFEKYAESFNDSYVERLGEQYGASVVDLINTPVQVVDMAKSLIDKDFDITDEDNLSTQLSNQSNELRTYAMAGTSGVENWSIQCISSLMPMMNAMLLGGGIGGLTGATGEALTNFTNTFTNVTLGAQTAGQVTRQRVMEGNNNVTAVLNGTIHGVITGLVEGLDAGRVASVFTGTAEKYLAKMSLLGEASPTAIIGYLRAMGNSEGAEEIIESLSDYLADNIQNSISKRLNGDNADLVNVEELDAKDLIGQYAMAYVGSVGLGLPTATKIVINSKRTYNAVNEAKNFFQSTIESSLATQEEKALAQECINVINHDMQEYDRKAVLSNAVNLQKDNVGSYGTFDEAMNNLANALRPDIQDATSTARQTMEKATQLKDTMQNALLQKGININSDQYMNLSENARDQVKAISSYAQESGNDVTVLFDTNMDANGSFEVVDGKPVITLNPNSEQAMPITYAHELVHSTEVNTKNYQQLVDLAFPDKTELNKAMNALKNSAYSGADATTLQKEAVAKKISEELLDNNFIDNMAKYNTEIGYKFLYDIRNTINDLKTNSNSLMQIESNLIKALNNQDTFYFEDGVSYSKKEDLRKFVDQARPQIREALNDGSISTKDLTDYIKANQELYGDYFDKNVEKIANGTWENTNNHILVLPESPKWLQNLEGSYLSNGEYIENFPMLMQKNHILNDLNLSQGKGNKHYVSEEVMKKLPELLSDPIGVFEYKHNGQYDGTILAFLDATDSLGVPLMASIKINGDKGRYASVNLDYYTNYITNVYSKDANKLSGFINKNLVGNDAHLLYARNNLNKKGVISAIYTLQLSAKHTSPNSILANNNNNVNSQYSIGDTLKSLMDENGTEKSITTLKDLKNDLKTRENYVASEAVTQNPNFNNIINKTDAIREQANQLIEQGKITYESITTDEQIKNMLDEIENSIGELGTSMVNGNLSEERKILDDKILNDYLDVVTHNEDGSEKSRAKEAMIVIGPPASGKSSAVATRLIQELNAVEIDSDAIKELLPEMNIYGGIMANFVHEESSAMAEIARDYLADNDYNMVIPIVGKSENSVNKIIDKLSEKGYKVGVVDVELPIENASVRAFNRWVHTGRYVPIINYLINKVGNNPSLVYEKVKNRKGVVYYAKYDNNVQQGQPARLIEEGGDQKEAYVNDGSNRKVQQEIPELGQNEVRPGRNNGNVAEFINESNDSFSNTQFSKGGTLEEAINENKKIDEIKKTKLEYSTDEINASVDEAFGIQPNDENVILNSENDTEIPERTEYGKTRRAIKTLGESNWLTKEDAQQIKDDVLAGKFSYIPKSNKASVNEAINNIQEKGYYQTAKDFLGEWDARNMRTSNIEGSLVLSELSRRGLGNTDLANKIKEKLAYNGTVLGEGSQVFAVLKNMSPELQIQAVWAQVQDIQDDLNDRYGQGSYNIELDESLINEYVDENTSETRRQEILQELAQSVNKQIPTSIAEYLNAWRHLAMLSNFRTGVKNRLSNDITTVSQWLRRNFEAGIEEIMAKKYAQKGESIERYAGTYNPTSAKDRNSSKYWKQFYLDNFKQFKGKYTSTEIGDVLNSSEFGRMVASERNVWGDNSNLLSKALNKYQGFENWMLSDTPAMKTNFAIAMTGYCKANNININDYIKNGQLQIDDKIQKGLDYSFDQAKYITLNNANKFASYLVEGEKKFGKVGEVIIESFFAYKKVPANEFAMGARMSPFKVLHSVYEYNTKLEKGLITPNQWCEGLASGLAGSTIVGLGALLAGLGLLRADGGDDDDPTRKENFDDDHLGIQDFAITLPNGGSYTIDWMGPAVAELMFGAKLVESGIFTGDEDIGESLTSVATSFLDVFFETTMMSGMQYNLTSYGDEWYSDLGAKIAQNYIMQFFPSSVSAIAQATDGIERRVKPNEGNIDKTWKMIKNKLPILRSTNEPNITTSGEEEASEDFGLGLAGRLFHKLVSPGTYKSQKMDEYDEELYRLYNETGKIASLPSNYSQNFQYDNEKYKFTDKEYTQFNKLRLSTEDTLVNQFLDSEVYDTFDDYQKVEVIEGLRDYAGQVAKDEILESKGIEYDDSSYLKVKQWFDMDIEDSQKLAIFIANKTIDSAKDENGETITNSKSYAIADAYADAGVLEDVFDYIEKYGLDSKDFGINKTVYKKSYKDIAKNYKKIYGEEFGTGYADAYAKAMSSK